MPFQAFAYRGRRVDVKGRTLEMAGRAERKVVAPFLSPRGVDEVEAGDNEYQHLLTTGAQKRGAWCTSA